MSFIPSLDKSILGENRGARKLCSKADIDFALKLPFQELEKKEKSFDDVKFRVGEKALAVTDGCSLSRQSRAEWNEGSLAHQNAQGEGKAGRVAEVIYLSCLRQDHTRRRSLNSDLNLISLLAQQVGEYFSVSADDILARRRGNHQISLARHVMWYLLHVIATFNYTQIAALCEKDRTSVRFGIWRVEDERDDYAFDRNIEELEHWFMGLIKARSEKRDAGDLENYSVKDFRSGPVNIISL